MKIILPQDEPWAFREILPQINRGPLKAEGLIMKDKSEKMEVAC